MINKNVTEHRIKSEFQYLIHSSREMLFPRLFRKKSEANSIAASHNNKCISLCCTTRLEAVICSGRIESSAESLPALLKSEEAEAIPK